MTTHNTDFERHAEALDPEENDLLVALGEDVMLTRAFEDGSDAYRAYGDGDAEALAYSPHVRLQEAFREGWDDAASSDDSDDGSDAYQYSDADASILACDLRALSHEQLVQLATHLALKLENVAQLREHNHSSKSWCDYAIETANKALLNSGVVAIQELSPDYVPCDLSQDSSMRDTHGLPGRGL